MLRRNKGDKADLQRPYEINILRCLAAVYVDFSKASIIGLAYFFEANEKSIVTGIG